MPFLAHLHHYTAKTPVRFCLVPSATHQCRAHEKYYAICQVEYHHLSHSGCLLDRHFCCTRDILKHTKRLERDNLNHPSTKSYQRTILWILRGCIAGPQPSFAWTSERERDREKSYCGFKMRQAVSSIQNASHIDSQWIRLLKERETERKVIVGLKWGKLCHQFKMHRTSIHNESLQTHVSERMCAMHCDTYMVSYSCGTTPVTHRCTEHVLSRCWQHWTSACLVWQFKSLPIQPHRMWLRLSFSFKIACIYLFIYFYFIFSFSDQENGWAAVRVKTLFFFIYFIFLCSLFFYIFSFFIFYLGTRCNSQKIWLYLATDYNCRSHCVGQHYGKALPPWAVHTWIS